METNSSRVNLYALFLFPVTEDKLVDALGCVDRERLSPSLPFFHP